MFTGIVQEVGTVAAAPPGRLAVSAAGVLEGIEPGGSVAVNGVCLTVTGFDKQTFAVDVMPETLRKTNLGLLRPGARVNLERPLSFGGEVGGHLVQGHVDGTGRVASASEEGEALLIRFGAPPAIMRYIVDKGFIAVDGVSLTVVARDEVSFQVSVVGYTRRNTVLAEKKTGDVVNLETDIIAKYAERLGQPRSGGLTAGFLQEHGFPVN